MKKIIVVFLPLLLFTVFAFRHSNNLVVTGTITDEKGLPVEGVSVRVIGTNSETVSDQWGNYRLGYVAENAVLAFSAIGIVSKQEKVNGRMVVNVTLVRNIAEGTELATVTVGALGMRSTAAKKTLRPTTIQTQFYQNKPVNVAQALSGKVSGCIIASNSPASSARVVLRGLRSVSGDNNPMIVLNGVPVPANAINKLHAKDIKRVDVLKGSQSSTLFGSEGINGAVVITTKNADTEEEDVDTEEYNNISENEFVRVTDEPLSTFSIDVDAASYSNVRRFLSGGICHLQVRFVQKS